VTVKKYFGEDRSQYYHGQGSTKKMSITVASYLNAPPINSVAMEDHDFRVDPGHTAVNEARAGNVEAFEALVLRYQGKIVNYASAMTRDASDAEDVAQETFIRAYRSLNKFRGDSSFKTWLYRIATNVARTHLGRRARQSRLAGHSLDDDTQALLASDVPSGETNIETTVIARDAINHALAVLPDKLRVAIILRDIEGLDYKEITRITGSPIGTIESRIFRARRALRPLLRSLVSATNEKEADDDVRTS
jgi:RNA polymerase sigma-70 factor (ECF subfamily)